MKPANRPASLFFFAVDLCNTDLISYYSRIVIIGTYRYDDAAAAAAAILVVVVGGGGASYCRARASGMQLHVRMCKSTCRIFMTNSTKKQTKQIQESMQTVNAHQNQNIGIVPKIDID